MQIILKKPNKSTKKKKIVGRGTSSGMGSTCGRGDNGQKSRSGYSKRFGFEGGQMPLVRRLPKKGFTSRKNVNEMIINLDYLEKAFNDGEKVNLNYFKTKYSKNIESIKILSVGKITKKLVIESENIKFSKNALEMLKKSGCIIEEKKEVTKKEEK